MMDKIPSNAELFLQKYRVLEGMLDKRYEGKKTSSSSPVIEYIRDDDSEPVRVDLDLMREIRNILSHNADSDGGAVVEPSDEMLDRLEAIIAYASRPHCACDFGTPADRIFSARLDDCISDVMQTMHKRGYSHVPVLEKDGVIGVFSTRSVFEFIAEHGMDSLRSDMRIADLGDRIRIDRKTGERYMFVGRDTSIVTVRRAFQRYTERNRRLSAVFVTHTGSAGEKLICMLTPWNVLSDRPFIKETEHANSDHNP